ncbi:MAG TPA: hypothetical protein P5040_08035 [Smithella sp.]|nr:hypothetical protein [Smithella sp.]
MQDETAEVLVQKLDKIEKQMDLLLSIFGKGTGKANKIETPATRQATIDAIVLRYQKKGLKKNG